MTTNETIPARLSPEARLRSAETDLGHELANDPPLLGPGQRWTCTRCGRAALKVPGGPLYGSAIREICVA